MELYLIRHGIAQERSLEGDDAQRPLTGKGRQKTEKVAQKLALMGIKFDLILTSPLLRARQTAQILSETGLGRSLQEFDALAPEGDLETWLSWLAQSGYNNDNSYLALVGHQPNLGNWAEALIWGSNKQKLVVKKAGIIGLRLPTPDDPVGESELFLLAPPKWILG